MSFQSPESEQSTSTYSTQSLVTTVCAPSGSFRSPAENTFHIYLKVPIMLEIPDRHLFFIKVATFLAC